MGINELHRRDTPLNLSSAEVLSKVQELRAQILPTLQGKTELQHWCTSQCLDRYLRARKYDVSKAAKMLKSTLQWREMYKPHLIKWEEVREEARTGKTFITSQRDREGRTVILMRPRHENTKGSEQQIRFLVYNLELGCRRADEGGEASLQEILNEEANFEGYSMRNAPSPKVGIQTLSILQNHYPERLGLAVCYHPPRLFSLMWKAVSPFVDPGTSRKIYFCEKGAKGDEIMQQFFFMEHIEECMGGNSRPQFDVLTYEQQQLADEALRRKLLPLGGTAAITADGNTQILA